MQVHVRDITIPIGELELVGSLAFPQAAAGLVMFAHGSGGSRYSPNDRHVATYLNARGLATLLFDLLTTDEQEFEAIEATLHCDVDLLADRLVAATDSIVGAGHARGLPLGYFGGAVGAAAALIAAAKRPTQIAAVVSRCGRLDLARSSLAAVQAPTLLIVGGDDAWVLQTNRTAAEQMKAPHRIDVIPGATHLFEEPGALDQVAQLASAWFSNHFAIARLQAAS